MGRPKLLLPWGDTTVIGQLVRQWRALGATQIVIVCRPGDEGLRAELDRLGVAAGDRIENEKPERGMFSSVTSAARWDGWRGGLASWVIVLGDQPHLRLESLRALLDFHGAHRELICQPSYGGRGRHPVVVPAGVFGELRYSRAETLGDFLRNVSVGRVECPLEDEGLSLDMDRPEDYGRIIHLNQSDA
jgi:molybdenum cofactor cytidylyltransferase